MDPIRNPFAPGAGTQPPELVGREHLREANRVLIERTRLQRPAKSLIMVGLRGVGKTVLLARMRAEADAWDAETLWIEAPEGRSLPAMLAPELRQALLRLSRNRQATALAQRALRALAGFARSLKVKYGDIEVGIDFDPEPGLADNGDLGLDLHTLLRASGEAALQTHTVIAIYLDEMQYVREEQLAALITGLHRTAQERLPIILVGAGLPQLRGRMGNAKSYAERMFDFPEVGPLSVDEVKLAIGKPIRDEGCDITAEALDRIASETRGYPYFVQEWGKHSWDAALGSQITLADVEVASATAIAALDDSFFRVRFDRLTMAEKRYLRAMAELGPGPHRSGDIAEELGRKVTSLAPTRASLIEKGMVYSPGHGDTAFSVPLFDEFMRRTMPPEYEEVGRASR